MNRNWNRTFRAAMTAAGFVAAVLLAGCPGGGGGTPNPPGTPDTPPPPDPPKWDQAAYDEGFEAGFLVDEEYWLGFDDGYYTRDAGPIYYSGSEIPVVEDPEYDAGYWDGVWYAYNDGYFVEYDYAFTVGFSEGYDIGYAADWLDIVAADEHPEYVDGGWSDGYNDGFSEGLVLGAVDYATALPFDWLDAMMYYREGNDVYLEEVDRGTGTYGPVYLYEYGTDPNTLVAKSATGRRAEARGAIRKAAGAKSSADAGVSYRTMPGDTSARYDTAPASTARAPETTLRVADTTWNQRIAAYRSATGAKAAPGADPRAARAAAAD